MAHIAKIAFLWAVTLLLVSCGSQKDDRGASSWTGASAASAAAPAAPGYAVMPKVRFDAVAKAYRAEYSETAEAQSCLVQSVHSCMSQAVSRKAVEKSDLNVCDDLSDEGFRKNCKNMVAPSLAEKSGDPKVCDALDDMNRRWCYSQAFVAKARSAKDPKACSGLTRHFPSSTGSTAGPAAWSAKDEVRRCESSVLSMLAKTVEDCAAISEPGPKGDCENAVRMRSVRIPSVPLPTESVPKDR